MPRPRVLYVTNPHYRAQGREYGAEDRYLTARLRDSFDIRTCLPAEAADLAPGHDLVVVRNSGPVSTYPDAYEAFRARARAEGWRVYNQLTGKADMVGKAYLPDLFAAGYPVVPTVSSVDRIDDLPQAERYVVKPLLGADSIGMFTGTAEEVVAARPADVLVQPLVDITAEVSFYFVDHTLVYALATPDPARRWDLEPFVPGDGDVAFARAFVEWNDIDHGIQRVDACRTTDGALLLLELEDLNPFLSLDRIPESTRERFVRELTDALHRLLG